MVLFKVVLGKEHPFRLIVIVNRTAASGLTLGCFGIGTPFQTDH